MGTPWMVASSKSSATLEVPGVHTHSLILPSFTDGETKAQRQQEGENEPQRESET